VRRAADIYSAFTAVDRLLAAFGLLPIDMALLQRARALPGNDFEDNVQIACAISAQRDLIVTNIPSGFQASPIPAIESSQIGADLLQP
jgi:hypothetical protein